ncbi:MAG: hypothetical protein LW688_05005 [Cryomorphaceae bacterium]|jgi:hypothetical protein|nr:hypothetical protein [Cryomorphaceae bacterium]
MRLTILISGILSSLIFGFIFAGIFGAFFFASILTITIYLFRKKSKNRLSKRGIVGYFISFCILGYLLMYLGGLVGADREITRKLELIKLELNSKGYKTSWIIISQKRLTFFNKLLVNSAKEKKKPSWHLKGKAIDVFVFDINGDNLFNKKDISIIEKANKAVENKYPELIGGLGDYFIDKNNYFTKHMIHFDTRGYRHRYTQ